MKEIYAGKLLLVGGAGQGKLDYACTAYSLLPQQIADGGAHPATEALQQPALNRLHLLVRRLLQAGQEPLPLVLAALDSRAGWVVLCDEIGSGVVPVDPFDRRWREETGRLCCALAARADIVERVTCGLPLRLKGEGAPCCALP